MTKQKKSIDRHVDPEMTVYPLRIPTAHLDIVRAAAKYEDRTRQALLREAIQQWVERRKK